MTEAEWLTFTTQEHGFHLGGRVSPTPLLTERRWYRLFAVAFRCRRVWQYIPDDRSKRVIDGLELLSDGRLTASEWDSVREAYSEADDLPNNPSQAERWALSAVASCLYEKENRLATSAARDCQSTVGADGPPGESSET